MAFNPMDVLVLLAVLVSYAVLMYGLAKLLRLLGKDWRDYF